MYSDVIERARRMVAGETKSPALWYRDASGLFNEDVEAAWPSPGTLHNYSCGFECQDYSARNTNKEKAEKLFSVLRHPPAHYFVNQDAFKALGRSETTLLASLVAVTYLLPRTVLLENVNGGPASELLAYLRHELPNYVWFGNFTDASDFGSYSDRFRLSIIGTQSPSGRQVV